MVSQKAAADKPDEGRASSARDAVLRHVNIELDERGSGKPLLLLHPEIGPDSCTAVADILAKQRRVIAPTHPGFGRSPAAPSLTTVDDLSYVYLDLLEQLDLRDVSMIGISLGAWIAAEIAIKSERISSLVLANPIGVKIGGREERDILDIFALRDEEYSALVYSDRSYAIGDYSKLSDAKLLEIARNRESTARYCWSPYMHDPKLRSRIDRINAPTLVLWGEDDGLASPTYGEAFARLIPGACFQKIAKAGRFPHVEQPELFAKLALDFAKA